MNPNPSPETRFKPGQSGNPAGKKPGTRNKLTVLLETMLDDKAEAILARSIEKAAQGNAASERLWVPRMVPLARRRAVAVDLPKPDTAEAIAEAGARIVLAVAESEITPEEGASLTAALQTQRRAVEAVAFEERIARLEEKLGLEGA
jgi:hypothetical protein